MKALRQFEYAQALQVVDIPIPSAVAGTAVLRILAANIISYTKNIYNGVRSELFLNNARSGNIWCSAQSLCVS